MNADAKLRQAAVMMAKSLYLFRGLANEASVIGEKVISITPDQLWEPSDQAALDAYEEAVNEINGAQPLFKETDHA